MERNWPPNRFPRSGTANALNRFNLAMATYQGYFIISFFIMHIVVLLFWFFLLLC